MWAESKMDNGYLGYTRTQYSFAFVDRSFSSIERVVRSFPPPVRCACSILARRPASRARRSVPKRRRGSRRFHSRGTPETICDHGCASAAEAADARTRSISRSGAVCYTPLDEVCSHETGTATRFFGHPRRPTGDASRPYRVGWPCCCALQHSAGEQRWLPRGRSRSVVARCLR